MIQYLLKTRNNAARRGHGMYLAILSRFPTENELQVAVEAYFQSDGPDARRRRGPGVGLDEQRGISLPALNQTGRL
jgi:hypothetical protein